MKGIVAMIHPAIIPESSIRRNAINQFGG